MARKKKRKQLGTGGLHLVALFEGAKGVLVLVTGFGLLAYIHKDVHEAAVQLVRHFHLNPASHYPRVFLDLMERVHSPQLWAMAGAALLYASVRIAEAIGLWLRQRWAEWFGVLTGGIYIPVEIYEVTRSVTWPKVTVLLVNGLIVAYLIVEVSRSGKKRL
ncbi:DUF2127 domain-containing protein [Geobacter pelophilus]|uniref:DUF2127 domain-containing protein n=1 Tax=Geoanaerobacter pelophilus TaxID=60036 RepID=A0AAW4LAE2_9BACT|nr:DUF2127 domain-containing protein [Geoanaerobacter pelophilus]MBT0665301.1 DUF2127 domain-containing protein [Geoanaerobacter pelophilus]